MNSPMLPSGMSPKASAATTFLMFTEWRSSLMAICCALRKRSASTTNRPITRTAGVSAGPTVKSRVAVRPGSTATAAVAVGRPRYVSRRVAAPAGTPVSSNSPKSPVTASISVPSTMTRALARKVPSSDRSTRPVMLPVWLAASAGRSARTAPRSTVATRWRRRRERREEIMGRSGDALDAAAASVFGRERSFRSVRFNPISRVRGLTRSLIWGGRAPSSGCRLPDPSCCGCPKSPYWPPFCCRWSRVSLGPSRCRPRLRWIAMDGSPTAGNRTGTVWSISPMPGLAGVGYLYRACRYNCGWKPRPETPPR